MNGEVKEPMQSWTNFGERNLFSPHGEVEKEGGKFENEREKKGTLAIEQEQPRCFNQLELKSKSGTHKIK